MDNKPKNKPMSDWDVEDEICDRWKIPRLQRSSTSPLIFALLILLLVVCWKIFSL